MKQRFSFLKVSGTKIVDERGRTIILKGVNLGGWLMMEGYILGGRNIPEKEFKKEFQRALGREALEDFTRNFRDTFIQEYDIRNIKRLGANCIRVPFNYRVIESEGLIYLDKIVQWCEKYRLYCILDMHAAPGSQNEDWHSDSSGKSELFTKEVNKNKYLKLWHLVAERYKELSAVCGYDLLNEPVIEINKEGILKDLYEEAIDTIRSVDKDHIIFLEGNLWGQRLEFLGRPKDSNTAFSIHVYPPIEFTFNFEKDLYYPGRINKIIWNRDRFKVLAKPYLRLMKKTKVPLYVGEFGINFRGGYYGELRWVEDILELFKEFRFSWTYWTYKAIASPVFPDGVYRYLKNPPWIKREGPTFGWENLYKFWPKERKRIISSWKTENFTKNRRLYSILKAGYKNC